MDLNDPTTVALLTAEALDSAGFEYALYGGLLTAVYGEPRETWDADVAGLVDLAVAGLRKQPGIGIRTPVQDRVRASGRGPAAVRLYSTSMFGRQEGGSVVCPSCGNLVGVRDNECLNCGRRNPGMWGFAPLLAKFGRGALDDVFVQGVIVSCSILFVATLLVGGIRMGGFLSFLSPGPLGLFLFGASGEQWVFGYGRWWTIFSASWLHGGIIHIFFNMYWVKMIGPTVIEFYGLGRMVIVYTIAGAAGFLTTSSVSYYLPGLPFPLSGASVTIGASAAIFGLIGALVYYGHRSGSRAVYQQASQWALFLFIFGLIIPGVDNWAHLGGFLGGYLAAKWMDPLQPERLDHAFGAVVCVVITVASIAWSVITGLPLLP